ncbi:MAG: pyrroline-5-carboxylate reductase [Limnochordia bacterium]
MTQIPIPSLASVGAGAMASALLRAWLRAGLLKAESVVAVDILPARRQALEEELGVRSSDSVSAGVARAQVVLVAVKPQHVMDVLPDIRAGLSPDTLVVSIAAGVPLALLEEGLGADTAVVRVMPNTPCLVGCSAAALSPGKRARAAQTELVLKLFRTVGRAFVLDESLLDAVTGLSGSGPAYVYLMIEALAEGGVAAGLPRDVALELSAQTVLGAAQMVLETKEHPARLREAVTSPAGTTAAGVRVLEKGALRAQLIEAVLAAAARSEELGLAVMQARRSRLRDND